MAHDFVTQKAETVAALDRLRAEHELPDVADIDFFLVPTSDDLDWQPLADTLTKVGFICEFFEAEDAEVASYLMATLPDQPITATGIWIGEETATRTGLEFGFSPDGWGLSG